MAGLRERKKAATRRAISDVATRLFIERGFDAVTVAEVAAAAEVAPNTLFNYFSTKEELFFDRAEEVVDGPARLVRDRSPGTAPVAALRDGLRAVVADAPDRLFSDRIVGFVRTIDDSPSLRAHLQLLFDEAEGRLADALRGTDLRSDPEVAAALLMGALRLAAATYRRLVHAGTPQREARAALLARLDAAFATLERGLS